MRRAIVIGALALLVGGTSLVTGQLARAQNVACVDFPTFADASGLVLGGNPNPATITPDGALRLTPAQFDQVGSAFSTTAFNLIGSRGLDTTFRFRITGVGGYGDGFEPAPNNGGDGFALLFAAAAESPAGTLGGGIGYNGIPNTVAVEFDTYRNGELGDPDGSHVGVHTRGTAANSANESARIGSAVRVATLSDGNIHSARVEYQPPSGTSPGLRVYVDNLTTPLISLPSFNMADNLNLAVGQGFLGFTSSTGGAYENHDILSWSACTVQSPVAARAAVVAESTKWTLGDALPGATVSQFSYGARPLTPLMGDWDGNGTITVGTFEGGTFKLNNQNDSSVPDVLFQFGDPRGYAVAGDYDRNGFDDIAVYRYGTWQIHYLGPGAAADETFKLAAPFGQGIWPNTVPVAGDWDGDGIDGIGTYDYATGTWVLKNTVGAGGPDIGPMVFWGGSGSYGVVGDFGGTGVDTPGYRIGTIWTARTTAVTGGATRVFDFGVSNSVPFTW